MGDSEAALMAGRVVTTQTNAALRTNLLRRDRLLADMRLGYYPRWVPPSVSTIPKAYEPALEDESPRIDDSSPRSGMG